MADDLNHDWYTITAWLAQDRMFMFQLRLTEHLWGLTRLPATGYQAMLRQRDELHDNGYDGAW